jgi:hypothetical protein
MKLSKVAIFLSSAAAFISLGFVIYNKFIIKEGPVLLWVLFCLGNLTILFANISVYKNEQKKEETTAKITEENKED